MTLITTQDALDAYIARIRGQETIFLDTEFLREKTYYPQLCLIQAKLPKDDAVAIDALAEGLDLAPFWAALKDPTLLKVFHAGRQDIEIIVHLCGTVPAPLFDTQIAAAVLGYGEQAGFETLARTILKHQLDKGSQFTDWSRRPLTDRQLTYALDDVRYLEPIYTKLVAALQKQNRENWGAEDLAILGDIKTYQLDPLDMWRRIRIRSDKPRDLAVLQAVAAWREREAQARDLPRGRILKDDPIVEIALHHPRTLDELMVIRGIDKGMVKGKLGAGLLTAVAQGLAVPDGDCPKVTRKKGLTDDQELMLDILKLIIKMRARELSIAPKMLASTDDLEALVRDGFKNSAFATGWRYDVLGRDLAEKPYFAFHLDVVGQTVTLETGAKK